MNIIKKIYFNLPLIFSIFFLFCSNVNADTTITFSSSYNTYYENNISRLISLSNDKLTQLGSDYTSYYIFYNPNGSTNNKIIVYFMYQSNNTQYYFESNLFRPWSINDYTMVCYMEDTAVNFYNCTYNSNFHTRYMTFPYNPLYSSISVPFNSYGCSGSLLFTLDSNLYTMACSSSTLVSYYDLYQEWHQTPPDDYPLLTSFYSIFIEKLSLLCEYVYTSYIFLSIFVVLIVYFSILLLRRLK